MSVAKLRAGMKRHQGWTSEKVDGVIVDRCPTCSARKAAENALVLCPGCGGTSREHDGYVLLEPCPVCEGMCYIPAKEQ